jgi:hypothetical protein
VNNKGGERGERRGEEGEGEGKSRQGGRERGKRRSSSGAREVERVWRDGGRRGAGVGSAYLTKRAYIVHGLLGKVNCFPFVNQALQRGHVVRGT